MRSLLYALLLTATPALAACPKSKKEWQALAPRLLVENAARKVEKTEIPDFTARLGKGAEGRVIPFKDKKRGEMVMVEAKDPKSQLFLSGVMRCDLHTKQPVLLSLTWVKGEQSGLVKLGK